MKNTNHRNSVFGISWQHIAFSAVILLAGVMLDVICARKGHKHDESMLDEALDGTFPASDATATQDFSSPEDRAALNH
jgi:hypothetical protein